MRRQREKEAEEGERESKMSSRENEKLATAPTLFPS